MSARHAVLPTRSVSSRPTHLHSSSQSACENPQFPVFVFKRLRTLSFSVSRKSCVCHSYENSRVCTNNSHCGTCGSPVNARKRVKFFLFKFLRTLLHTSKCQRLCFQAFPHSLRKTWGVGCFSAFGGDADPQKRSAERRLRVPTCRDEGLLKFYRADFLSPVSRFEFRPRLAIFPPFQPPICVEDSFMRRLILSLFALLAVAFAASAQQPPVAHFDGKTWWEHVKVVADDKMEGRETGSEGLRKAQAYIVEQLKQAGLEPAGTNGFYQPIKFISREIIEKDSSLGLVRNAAVELLTLGEEAYFGTRVDLSPDPIQAPLVFVGYGLVVPEKNYDDLAGLDLKGKVAVLLSGSPADVPGALASHYQSAGERWKPFHQAGAIGIITIPNPASMDIPWSRMSLNRAHPSMELADPEFNETAGLKTQLTFNPANAEKLFVGSGHTFAELAALAKDRKPLPRFPLAASLKARA